jgi:2,4-dienoyl-CoA reductase-like NADH-dependent reductase (Old Yellow Enzyme family)
MPREDEWGGKVEDRLRTIALAMRLACQETDSWCMKSIQIGIFSR